MREPKLPLSSRVTRTPRQRLQRVKTESALNASRRRRHKSHASGASLSLSIRLLFEHPYHPEAIGRIAAHVVREGRSAG